MPNPAYLFVQVQHTGKVAPRKDVRTAIQKHVMRDIGASRRGRPRRKAIDKQASGQCQVPVSTGAIMAPSLVSGGTRTNPFASYPIPMNSDTFFLIDYSPRLRPFRDTWLPLGLSDPALFYEILSHISLDIAAVNPGYSDRGRSRALELHLLALRDVNRRLEDPCQGLSEGVIGAVLAFACFSHIAKDWKSYEAHMEGLRTIIRLKGGLHKLDNNRILRLLLSGIDVSASCFNNAPVKFPLPLRALSQRREERQEVPWWLPVGDTGGDNVWELVFPSDDTLAEIFRDVATTIMTVKLEHSRSGRPLWQDTQFVRDYIDPLTHRLLDTSIETDAVNRSNFVNECSRLAALLLLSKIRRASSPPLSPRIVFTGIETDRLRALLARYYSEWTVFKPMLLWVLVLGALEVEGEERAWFCALIQRTAEEIGLRGWDEVVVSVSNLLWVGEVLHAEGEALRGCVWMEA
ncbi:uncharacterized protein BDZ99DRAFT_575220 [Mytilinidion resinicola]|uniref:Fungal-specific transcription factor domain-containing protein n=1 Tax=Mytilinidion resinicola TaxID=574789 RepID=A0A6A6Y7P1_9PEZI|nr:uncharacterized protein BDZ99DRAFT_575220 [Mytilinidion resinicola]KAF2804568.1 hypothetical protein BDZ99DRAFT_575220 [Mytilinidion resinicola]